MGNLESKRKFLIVSSSADLQEKIKKDIEAYVSLSLCLSAGDGSEAISKIQNDPPDVVIAEPGLSKTDEFKLASWILRNQKENEKIAIIILSSIPNTEHFVDEVVTGQVQFANFSLGTEEIKRVISNSLNFISRQTTQEFFLRFLVKGDCLIKENEKADNMYLLKKGELTASIRRDGNEIVLGKIQPGEFVGEMAYINGEPRSADVHADTDCELIEIPINVLDKVLFTKVAWSKALMRTLSKRIKRSNDTVQDKLKS